MSNPTLLVFAEILPDEISELLSARGMTWKIVDSASIADRLMPDRGWAGALVMIDDLHSALDFCRTMRHAKNSIKPLLLVGKVEHLNDFIAHEKLFDDFIVLPLRPIEFEIRFKRLMNKNVEVQSSIIEYESIELNLSTYQAAVSGRPLDMTYMEYELLRHFVTHPTRVLTREELLHQVWGYEYYGGTRTVDVHVRRLRAKLGDEHASLIQTVRSVGYMFGRTRWDEVS